MVPVAAQIVENASPKRLYHPLKVLHEAVLKWMDYLHIESTPTIHPLAFIYNLSMVINRFGRLLIIEHSSVLLPKMKLFVEGQSNCPFVTIIFSSVPLDTSEDTLKEHKTSNGSLSVVARELKHLDSASSQTIVYFNAEATIGLIPKSKIK